jgi:anti-sigma factor RsiW
MFNCRDVIMDLLFDYLDESLGPELVTELEGHLKVCAACRSYVETYRKTRQLAGAAARPPQPDDKEAPVRAFRLKRLAGPTA